MGRKKKEPETTVKAEEKEPVKKRDIRRMSDLLNSELKMIADILQIRIGIPRTSIDRSDIMMKIRRILR